jgi:hypothetical protein
LWLVLFSVFSEIFRKIVAHTYVSTLEQISDGMSQQISSLS